MAWRDQYHNQGYLWLHAATVVFQCEITAVTAVSGSTNAVKAIEVNTTPSVGTLADVKAGMMVVVGTSAGDDDYGRARVRGTLVGSNLIYVWVSQNVKDGELKFDSDLFATDHNYVTVYDDRRMWMKPPYADGSGNYTYDGDDGPQGVTYEQIPVANCGVSGYINFFNATTRLVTVSLSAATSFAVADDAVLGAYTSDQAPTYFASPLYDNMTDGNTVTYWESPIMSTGPHAVSWDYGAANDQAVRQIVITGHSTQSPYLFFLQWSDDQTTYYTAFEGTETGWGASEVRTFNVHHVGTHRYWRLWIFAIEAGAASTCRIREFEVYSEDRTAGTSPWSWDVGGGTITVGSSTTQDITATFPAGCTFVELSVTDTTGETGTKTIPVVGVKPPTFADPDPAVEIDSITGCSYAASSELVGHEAQYAFDGTTNYWSTDTTVVTGSVVILFPATQFVGAYDITAYIASYAPKNWTFQGSNNGSAYTTLDTRTGETFTLGEKKSYTCQSHTGLSYTYYRLNVTLNGGSSQFLAVRELDMFPLAVTDQANLITNFEVTGQTMLEDGRGQTFEFTVHESIPESTYLDGCRVMYFEREYYDLVEGSLSAAGPTTGFEHIKFNGWIDEEPAAIQASVDEGLLTGTTLRCIDAGGRLQQLIDFSLMAERDAAPAEGYEMKHANADTLIYLILRWLTTAVEICEYIPSFTADGFDFGLLAAQGGNLFDCADQKAKAMGFDLVCTKHNHLNVIPNPLVCAPEWDDFVGTLETLTAADYTSIEYVHSRTSRTHWAYGSGVGFLARDADHGSFTAYPEFVVAPGTVPGQGVGGISYDDMLVNFPYFVFSSSGIDFETASRVGRLYAQDNAQNSVFSITLVPAGDTGLDPACGQWLNVTLPAAIAAQRGLTLTTQPGIIRRVDVAHDHDAMTKTITIEWEMQEPAYLAKAYLPV